MPKIIFNGLSYGSGIGGGGNANFVELTKAEYDALEAAGEVKADILYLIKDGILGTDAGMGNTDISGIGDGTVTGAIGALNDNLSETKSVLITASYVGGNIKFVKKNGMCLASYLDDFNNIPAGNMGIIGTIPEGYRPLEDVVCMCAPYNQVQLKLYSNGDISAYNYGSAISGNTPSRFSICYPVK